MIASIFNDYTGMLRINIWRDYCGIKRCDLMCNMKKIFLFFVFLVLSVSCFGQKKHDNVLKDEYEFIGVNGKVLSAFKCKKTGDLIGFFKFQGKGFILLEPQFQDAYYEGGDLVAVKKNGKWGVVDMGYRYVKDLIVPCEHSTYRSAFNAVPAVREQQKQKYGY